MGRMRSIVSFWLAASVVAHACKYTVRDVAFVDLGDVRYRLVVVAEDAVVERVLRVAAAALAHANLDVAAGKADERIAAAVSAAGLSGTPCLVLCDPAGEREICIPLHQAEDEDAIWDQLSGIVSSPARKVIVEGALDAHSTVLIVAGSSAELNARARALASAAVAATVETLGSLPKVIETPPRILTLTQVEAAAEEVLLWGLGLEDRDPDDAWIVVLFGRGRRLGEPLSAAASTRVDLLRLLGLVGQDCECGLDRSAMQGTMIPHQWGSDLQQELADALGFDGENPRVKAEISRILSRGGAAVNSRPPAGAGLLGYREVELDAAPVVTPPSTLPALPAATPAGGQARAPAAADSPQATAPTVPPYRPLFWTYVLGGLLLAVSLLWGGALLARSLRRTA